MTRGGVTRPSDGGGPTGVVLAGGRGTRMGGPKALLPVGGVPLFRRAVDALAPLCREVLVLGGPDAARLAPHAGGARVLGDAGEGPPRALVLAAWVARGDALLVLAGDMPRVESAALRPLLDAGPDATFAVEGVAQTLAAIYRRETLLAFRGRSLREIPARRVDAGPWAAALRDADVPADLA